jgi:hypothetical protein
MRKNPEVFSDIQELMNLPDLFQHPFAVKSHIPRKYYMDPGIIRVIGTGSTPGKSNLKS